VLLLAKFIQSQFHFHRSSKESLKNAGERHKGLILVKEEIGKVTSIRFFTE